MKDHGGIWPFFREDRTGVKLAAFWAAFFLLGFAFWLWGLRHFCA
jgi:hypothetical protein